MPRFSLSDSLKVRNQIDKQQYRDILKLYKSMAERAREQAKQLEGGNLSSRLQSKELEKLAKQLQKEAEAIGKKLEGTITDSLSRVSQAVVDDANRFNGSIGLSAEGAYRRVPADIVEVLVSGKLYDGDWTLSKAIWTDIRKTQSDINTVVAQGLALNKSAYEIAKDLEKYVDPSAKKPWDWSKVYPGTKKKVDYNAQRLARTMVGHAYQQSVMATCKDDPFVDGVKWISGHTSTSCEICEKRNGKIFPADKLPMDHPNGKCSFAPAVSKSMTQIADELADWAQGKSNPGMDRWFKAMYPQENLSSGVLRKMVSGKSLDFEKVYLDMAKDMSKGQMRNALLGMGVDFDEVASMSIEQLEMKITEMLIKQRNQAIVRMEELQSSYKNVGLGDIEDLREIFKLDIPRSLNYQSTFQKFVYSTGRGNGKPQVVDKLPSGSMPLFRGVKDSTLPGSFINDLTRYDDMSYMGNGIFGDGIYLSTSEGAANTYGGSIMKATISPRAKIVDYDVVYQEMMEDGFGSKVGTGDVSTYAILKGYDVIYQRVDRFEKGETYYNIINREVLIIEK